MSHKNYNSQQATSQTMPTGLSLSGVVISRVMRHVPKDKPTIEVYRVGKCRLVILQ